MGMKWSEWRAHKEQLWEIDGKDRQAVPEGLGLLLGVPRSEITGSKGVHILSPLVHNSNKELQVRV